MQTYLLLLLVMDVCNFGTYENGPEINLNVQPDFTEEEEARFKAAEAKIAEEKEKKIEPRNRRTIHWLCWLSR